jgi:hypothetical protein
MRKTHLSDPPPRAARLGAASGVEGPGRAQRQRREHDRPLYDALSKEQPFEPTGALITSTISLSAVVVTAKHP